MTSQSPRIYLYKITFEEVPYYYYGVHKEKYFNEEYWGTPITHKWCWEFYTPKKQILQYFDFTDKGWVEAQEVEGRLIRPVFNTDKWCLNESCMGIYSLVQKSKAGKIGGKKIAEEKIGIFGRNQEDMIETSRKGGRKSHKLNLGIYARSPEQIIKDSKKGGKIAYEMKVGIHALTLEEKIGNAKKGAKIGGQKAYEMKVGIHGLTSEERVENSREGGKIAGRKIYENKLGIHGRSPEQMSEDGRKGGSISVKIVNSQRWECCETGYVSTAAGIVVYQRARGIDTSKSNRRRIA